MNKHLTTHAITCSFPTQPCHDIFLSHKKSVAPKLLSFYECTTSLHPIPINNNKSRWTCGKFVSIRKIHVWKTKQDFRDEKNMWKKIPKQPEKKRVGKISNYHHQAACATRLLSETWRRLLFLCLYTNFTSTGWRSKSRRMESLLFYFGQCLQFHLRVAHVRLFPRNLKASSVWMLFSESWKRSHFYHEIEDNLQWCASGKAKKTPTLQQSPINSSATDESRLVNVRRSLWSV